MPQQKQSASGYAFLKGGGEMASLIAAYDWSATRLGHISTWPRALRAAVSLMLKSRFPMVIFWGPELITFYNDAFRPSLGDDGKHPGSLGQRGEESWAESWPTIGPMIYDIMAGGEAVWFEDQKLPLYRDGEMGYAYWTYSFSPIEDGDGSVDGLLVTCAETTRAVESLEQLTTTNQQLAIFLAENRALQEAQHETHLKVQESQHQLLSLFEQSPVAIATIARDGLRFTSANTFYAEMVGRKPEDIIGRPLLEALPEINGQGFDVLLNSVLDTGVSFTADEVSVDLMRHGGMETRYVNLAYQPMLEDDGSTGAVLVVASDVTPQVISRMAVQTSEARFQQLVRDAAVGIILLMGKDLRVEMVNNAYAKLVGHAAEDLLHRPLFDVIPDAEEVFRPIIEGVKTTGEDFSLQNAPYHIKDANGQVVEGFVTVIYQPYRDTDGTISGVMMVVHEVTEQVVAQKAVQNSEARFRSLIEQAPIAKCLFIGPDFKIEIANEAMIQVWGKGRSVMGKPLAEALPELEGQPFLPLMARLYATGESFESKAGRADLVIDGSLKTFYFNYAFKPMRNEFGEVYGILETAVDITELVLAGKAVEESEASLRNAIQMADLGTWNIDALTGRITYSPRLQEWLGLSSATLGPGVSPSIHARDAVRVREAVTKAMEKGGSGRFDEVYTIINAITGEQRIIHANGQAFYDAQGAAVRLAGTAQDVTMQHEMQLALENEVQTRTEELASILEELRLTNNDLTHANEQLTHSNEELAQYAYVASHDLQEPLRKIQVFATMMQRDAGLPKKALELADKIAGSADRMGTLIRDLLDFSRLLKSDALFRPIDLNVVVRELFTDFELVAQEKGATFTLSHLPTIEAVPLQMNQLFHNLLSNSLKFTAEGVAPVISISSRILADEEARSYIRTPLPFATYYEVCVQDNGIGFDKQYADQIFEVFKRLHTRDAYAGSGIGLALCRRIVANHRGALYPHSTPGEGARFCLILPDRQTDTPSTLPEGISLLD